MTEKQPARPELQATGSHPAPCARFCEAQAFKIDARNLHARIADIEAQLEAVGAGGVEPLRKRECLHQISEPAQPVALDAARYRFLRDGEWRRTDLESVIRLQLNTLWDSHIDAAIAAKKGEKS